MHPEPVVVRPSKTDFEKKIGPRQPSTSLKPLSISAAAPSLPLAPDRNTIGVFPVFERYTEKARRSIFFARYEASQFGSAYIEPEHFLLGMMHQTVGAGFPAAAFDTIRAEIEKIAPRGTPFPTSVDLPVSKPVKRALERAAKEADRLGHENIDVQHLLLGFLEGDDSIVPGILRKHAIDRESILRDIQVSPRREDGPEVVETHHRYKGHKITPIGHFRLSEDGRTLSYTQEIKGPGKSAQHTIEFDIS